MTSKINTDEEARESIKNTFLKMGLTEDGSILDKKEKGSGKFIDQFRQTADKVEAQWDKTVPEEVQSILEEDSDGEVSADDDTVATDKTEEEKQKVLQAEIALQAKDDAIAKMQKMIDDLSEQTSKQQKAEQNRILESIENQRKQAVIKGDYDAVVQLDQQKSQVLGQTPVLDPVYADFLKRNPWWNGTSPLEIKMRATANQYDNVISKQKLTPAQGTSLLEECMRNDFPEYFDKDKKKVVAAVEGNVKAGVVKNLKRSYNTDNLDNQSKYIVKEFARLGKVKPDDYLKELAKAGLIK